MLDDAALRQAVHEVAVGGYLSAGQRCTGTERVLVHRKIADRFIDALATVVRELQFGNPEDAERVRRARSRRTARSTKLERAIEAARKARRRADRRRASSCPAATTARRRCTGCPTACTTSPATPIIEVFGPDLVRRGDRLRRRGDRGDRREPVRLRQRGVHRLGRAVRGSSPRGRSSGILNRNRSTNLASPKLPFGGVGKSGNYRPAGAWAHRNVTAPVAMLENVLGAVDAAPACSRRCLPAYDLDRLEAPARRRGGRRGRAQARRSCRGRCAIQRPAGGVLPESAALLARLYAGDRVPKEKKPPVFDHLRSAGPWMVSIDAEPLAVLDGMSQTATVVGGFAEDPVVRAYTEGEFADTLVAQRRHRGRRDVGRGRVRERRCASSSRACRT